MDKTKKKEINKENIEQTNHKSKITSKDESKLESLKVTLHKMIDEITVADYVDFNYGLPDATSENMKPLIRIIIEKNGNIFVGPKEPPHFRFEDEFDD